MENPNSPKSNVKLVWIVAAIFAFLYGAAVLIYGLSNPEFGIGKMILWILLGWIVVAGGAGGFHWNTKREKEKLLTEGIAEKLPPPIKKAEARAYAQKLISGEPFSDYLSVVMHESSALFGKSKRTQIYTLKGRGKYNQNDSYCVIINQHVPEELSTVLINPSNHEIAKYQNLLSIDPEDEPVVEERIDRDLQTGKESVYRKRGKSEEPEKKEEKEDDL